MQEILEVVAKAALLIALMLSLWHLLRSLIKPKVSERTIILVGIDGLVMGLAGGVLTSAGLGTSIIWAIGGGSVFYVLAALSMDVDEESADEAQG